MLLPASPLDEPETRREWVERALQRWDRAAFGEALSYAAGLFGWREANLQRAMESLFYWFKEQGRRWPALERGDLLAFWALVERGQPPLAKRPLRRPATVYSWWWSLRRVLAVIAWAGLELPPLDFPPRPSYLSSRPYLSDDEFARLLQAAREYPTGALRRLGVAVLYLLGEAAVAARELFALRLGDFDPARRVLRVRGPKAREVPLSEAAVEALEAYLEDREMVLAGQPLGSPYLLVRMTHKKGGLGRPLGADTLNGLLERLEALAGLEREGLLVPLRWRAVRKLFEQGLSPQEVARRTGLVTVVGRGGRGREGVQKS